MKLLFDEELRQHFSCFILASVKAQAIFTMAMKAARLVIPHRQNKNGDLRKKSPF